MRLVFSLFIEVYDNLSIDYACIRVGQIIHFECYIRGFGRVTVMFQFEQYYFGERYYFNDRIQFLLLRAKFWLFFFFFQLQKSLCGLRKGQIYMMKFSSAIKMLQIC